MWFLGEKGTFLWGNYHFWVIGTLIGTLGQSVHSKMWLTTSVLDLGLQGLQGGDVLSPLLGVSSPEGSA